MTWWQLTAAVASGMLLACVPLSLLRWSAERQNRREMHALLDNLEKQMDREIKVRRN
jgi:hypothetical protein